MVTSAELIEALRRRRRRSLRPPPPPGEFPPGWREWFIAIAARPGVISGARADDVVAVMAAREPAVSQGLVAQLGRWRAFTTFWRQDWEPASRDERWMRIVSASASLLLHLLFVVTLAWLMFSRFHFPTAPEEARDGEEHVLQVEYIGEGTPEDAGGGAPMAPADVPAEPAPAAPAPIAAAAPAEPSPVPPVTQPPREVPEETAPEHLPPPLPVRELLVEVPQLASPSIQALQDLQVTEVDVPDSRFEVPPPQDLEVVDVPAATVPDVSVRQRDIDVRETGQVQVSTPRPLRELEVAVPEASPQGVAVVERRIELAEATGVALDRPEALADTGVHEVSVDAPAARVRDVPMPAARPAPDNGGAGAEAANAAGEATSSATREVAGEGAGSAPATLPPGGRPEASDGARGTANAPGAGRQAGQPPGALPSTRASDDWGDSTRNVAGDQVGRPGASGLFNADGSPRLAGDGRVGGGLPPGAIIEDFENIDRHGTWLKRPPYDYEPTAFDHFWLPSESLLEEWVRKSVTEVRIPIPGTTKTIRCVTVMLALGGGCGIEDPNLQEEPTHGRPAPEIPFKRELQEDQESLGPASRPER